MLRHARALLAIAVSAVMMCAPNAMAQEGRDKRPPPARVAPPRLQAPVTIRPTRPVIAQPAPIPPQLQPANVRLEAPGAHRFVSPGAIPFEHVREFRRRDIVRHVMIRGHELPLPGIVVFGQPVILEVPDVGRVEIPEEDYPVIFELLSSPDPQQMQQAIELLRDLQRAHAKAEQPRVSPVGDATDKHGPINMLPPGYDER